VSLDRGRLTRPELPCRNALDRIRPDRLPSTGGPGLHGGGRRFLVRRGDPGRRLLAPHHLHSPLLSKRRPPRGLVTPSAHGAAGPGRTSKYGCSRHGRGVR